MSRRELNSNPEAKIIFVDKRLNVCICKEEEENKNNYNFSVQLLMVTSYVNHVLDIK